MKFSGVISLGLLLVVTQPSTQNHIAPRIIGGSKARAGQFGFAAALYVQKPGSTNFCGGCLLSSLWVLTTSSCVNNATLVTVQLGSTTLSGTDPNRLVVATDNIVLHPLFDPDTLENDIGLIMFRIQIMQNDYIRPATYFPLVDLPGSDRVTTVGWGQISDEIAGVTNDLQYVELTTITNEECRITYGSQIVDTMVCVSGNFNEGICNGDNGSPLIQNVGGGNTLIVGVATFLSSRGCESTDPSGYTKVFPHKQWITAVTGIL